SARLWEVAGGNAIRTLTGHTAGVNSVAFSPDGKSLYTASTDKTVRVWEVASGNVQLQLEGHGDLVDSVAVSPDGKLIATACGDKIARLWDATGKELRKLEGSDSRV